MTERVSLERAIGDRLLELGKEGGCAKDALFHHLFNLRRSTLNHEHDYLISAVSQAAKTVGAHSQMADEVVAHIKGEHARVLTEQRSVLRHSDGTPCGIVRLDARTQESAQERVA